MKSPDNPKILAKSRKIGTNVKIAEDVIIECNDLIIADNVSIGIRTQEKFRSVAGVVIKVEKLVIDCGAGYLKVSGDKNLNRIEVAAEIIVEKLDDDDAQELVNNHIQLSLKKRGKKVVLISHYKKSLRNIFRRNPQVQINLTVKIPENIDLEVEDGSGSIEVNGIDGYVMIEDGSGNLKLRQVIGDVEIEDGSGSMTVTQIDGNLDIDDGSGNVVVRDVEGSVYIEDGSGSMEIEHIGGSVVVDDGSGSITIDDVERNVTIEDAGSGGLTIKNVKGHVENKDK